MPTRVDAVLRVGVLAAALAIGFLLSQRLQSVSEADAARIQIDMFVSEGSRLEVFLNDTSRPPMELTLVPGVRHTYEVGGVRQRIELLRFDTTDTPRATVRIYGVTVLNRHRVLAQFGPKELESWGQYGLQRVADPDALAFESLGTDPLVLTTTHIDVLPTSVEWAAAWQDTLYQTPTLVVVMLVVTLVASTMLRQEGLATATVFAVIAGCVPVLMTVAASHAYGGDRIDVAVSRASYLGIDTRANQIASLAGLLTSVVVGLCGFWFVRRIVRRRATTASVDVQGTSLSWRWLSVVLALWVCTLAPDLRAMLQQLSGPFHEQWDSQNVTYWSYLAHTGALPLRDYWFPYGGFYLFDRPWPVGPLVRWGFDVALYGLLTVALWLLAPQRRRLAVGLVLTLIVFDRLALLWEGEQRYLLAPLVALSYAALERADNRERWVAGVSFAASVALIATFELVQLLYAAPGIAVLVALRAWCRPRGPGGLRRALRVASIGVLITASVLAVFVLLWMSTGQLQQILLFYARIGDSAQYSAFPTPWTDIAWRVWTLPALVCWWPGAMIGLALLDLAGDRERHHRGAVILALAATTAMTTQKHFIRPMEAQLLTHVALTAFCYLLLWPGRVSGPALALAGAVVGFAAVPFLGGPRATLVTRLLVDAPSRVLQNVRLVADSAQMRLANEQRFAAQRFQYLPVYRELLDALEAKADGPMSLFALSDDPLLYIMSRQAPVWSANMYNASPVYEQQHLVRWLQQQQPTYVVFDRRALQFDSIPTVVRVPIVVAAVVDQYVPDGRIGRFDVARRRTAGEPIAFAHWRNVLGAVVDLGHLPANVDLRSRSVCEGPSCDQYLRVTVSPSQPAGSRASATFMAGGLPFEATFVVREGQGEYIVPLSHLWMWRVATVMGEQPVVTSAQAGDIETLALAPAPDVLY